MDKFNWYALPMELQELVIQNGKTEGNLKLLQANRQSRALILKLGPYSKRIELLQLDFGEIRMHNGVLTSWSFQGTIYESLDGPIPCIDPMYTDDSKLNLKPPIPNQWRLYQMLKWVKRLEIGWNEYFRKKTEVLKFLPPVRYLHSFYIEYHRFASFRELFKVLDPISITDCCNLSFTDEYDRKRLRRYHGPIDDPLFTNEDKRYVSNFVDSKLKSCKRILIDDFFQDIYESLSQTNPTFLSHSMTEWEQLGNVIYFYFEHWQPHHFPNAEVRFWLTGTKRCERERVIELELYIARRPGMEYVNNERQWDRCHLIFDDDLNSPAIAKSILKRKLSKGFEQIVMIEWTNEYHVKISFKIRERQQRRNKSKA